MFKKRDQLEKSYFLLNFTLQIFHIFHTGNSFNETDGSVTCQSDFYFYF